MMANFSFNAPLQDKAIAQVPPLQFRANLVSSRLLTGVFPQISKGHTTIVLQVQALHENGVVLYDTGFIHLRTIHWSQQVTEIDGVLPDVEATINLVFTELEGTQTVRLIYIGNSHDVVTLDKYNRVLQTFRDSSQIRIANAQSQTTYLINKIQEEKLSDVEKFTERMVHALAVVVKKTGLRILLPEKFSVTDVSITEEVAKILETGITLEKLNISDNSVFGATVRLEDCVPFLNAQNENAEIAFKTPGGERTAKIQGYEIPLGDILYEFQNVKVHNYDELNDMVKKGEPGNTPVTIYFDIDREHIVTLFEKWAAPEQLETNWIDVLSVDPNNSDNSNVKEPSPPQLNETPENNELVLTEPPGTLARLAQIAAQRPIDIDSTDLVDRSREILAREYPKYLSKRMNRPASRNE